MDTARWQQIEDLFHHAVRLSIDAREPYLAEVCAHDVLLREEVESLLSSYEGDRDFLQRPAFERGLKVLAGDAVKVVAGDKFGSYTILSDLGRGGMGSVYLALDSRLGRKVAIKVLSFNFVKDETRLRRFRQEARAASKISHPNVAAIYEISSVTESHFIAMEFVDGMTLRERLSQAALPLKEAIDIAIQVGLAIESAHATGIVHRDIKPENIMVRRDGYVKVLDFGLAKLTEAYQHHAGQDTLLHASASAGEMPTEPGMLMGTFTYMSPEQARGLPVDPRTDIWSWGVVLYETIAGDPPFQGETTSDLLADILRAEPPSLAASQFAIPRSLQEVLRRSLTKNREARYATMADALADMRRLQRELDIHGDAGGLESEFKPVGQQDFSTRKVAQAESGKINAPRITDSHLTARLFNKSAPGIRQTFRSISKQLSTVSKPTRVSAIALILGVAIFVTTVLTVRQLRHSASPGKPLQFTRLSSEGNVIEAAISPDGKYVASVVDEADARSLWIRQTNTAANLQIIPPTQAQYGELSFSPDGENIYYVVNKEGIGILYLVSTLGGAPRKLSEEVDTPITFSPDGGRMAFVRQGQNGQSALITANPDGTDEKTLAKLQPPLSFWSDWQFGTGPVWSPDGDTIACPVFDETDGAHADVLGVRTADGIVKRINAQKGFLARVRRLIWLPDSSGLIMTARDQNTSPHQLWFLSSRNGEARNLSNDAEEYVGLSATKDSRTLLTTKVNAISSLWVIDLASHAEQVASTNHDGGNGISWTADGRIVYARNEAALSDIWVMNPDGSSRKQLTYDGQRNAAPIFSPDGHYVVFVSYREGIPHVWRIDADGKDLKQLTTGTYEDMPTISRDSKWVIYHRLEPAGLWRVSINGGQPIRLTKEPSSFPDVSSDGKLVAYLARDDQPGSPWKVTVISSEGGPPMKVFELPAGFNPSLPGIRWTPDSLKITFVLSAQGAGNIWSQAIAGGPPSPVTTFAEGKILYFSWSVDGKLACIRGTATKDLFLMREFR
jgi:eukaryotic-like serine/threonine-protein kinase